MHSPHRKYSSTTKLSYYYISSECATKQFTADSVPAPASRRYEQVPLAYVSFTQSPQVPQYCFTTQLISPSNAMRCLFYLSSPIFQPWLETLEILRHKMASGKSNYVFRIYMLYLILFVLPKIPNINLNFNPIIYLSLSSSSSTSYMADTDIEYQPKPIPFLNFSQYKTSN